MFSIMKAQPGDVLAYRSKGDIVGNGIALFSNLGRLFSHGGKYVHTAMYIGSGRVIHSHLNVDKNLWIAGAKETGVHIAMIDPKEHDIIDIYRLPHELRHTQQQALIRWARKHLGAKYDLAAFPSSFIRSVIARIFGWRNFSKERPILNDPKRWFCSEFVACAYSEALNIDLVPSIHPMSQTPSDIVSNKSILKRVF